MDLAMLFGYSLVIDEYVDANQLEPADCDLLKVCCPVCMNPVSLIRVDGRADLSHVQAVLDDRAREKRLATIAWYLFKDLLNKDRAESPRRGRHP